MASFNLEWSVPALQATSATPVVQFFTPYTRWPDPVVAVGTTTQDHLGATWVFGRATAAVAVSTPAANTLPTPAACAFNTTTFAIGAGTGYKAHAPLAINEYGWIKKD